MPWDIRENFGDCKGFAVVKRDDDEIEGCHETREAAEAQMRALYASENRADEPRAPVENRSATMTEVNFPQRTIEVLAMPYDQEAVVEYRGELWKETFAPGAFSGVEKRPNRVKAFRDHEAGAHLTGTARSGLVGKVVRFMPEHPEGLLSSVKIAKTPLGDETLALADEGILGVSLGFAAKGRDQVFDRYARTRRVNRAYVDHLAFPDEGAYAGAQVIDVRRAPAKLEAPTSPIETPRLDEILTWMQSRRP